MPTKKVVRKDKVAEESDPRKFVLDAWQARVLRHEGNIVLRIHRQGGKSVVVSLKSRKLAYDYPGSTTLVIAAGLRQASLLFEKIRAMFESDNREKLDKIMKGMSFASMSKRRKYEREHGIFLDDPTQTRIKLKNGSTIYCLPTGKTGAFIRGYTADFIIADEASRIPDPVFVAIEPMLLVARKARGTGWMIALSTPTDKDTWFYEACHDPDFLELHVTADKCSRLSKKDLLKKKKKLSTLEYAQEYLALFIEGFRRYFKDYVIKRCVKISWVKSELDRTKQYFLGVDVARFGRDDNAFVVAEIHKKKVRIVHAEVSNRKDLMDTAGKIITLDLIFNFKKIYIDATGVGGGVVDTLREGILKYKIVETNNAAREIAGKKLTRTLKEDMYSTALIAMEQGNLELLDYKPLIKSLKAMSFDYGSTGNLKIFGKPSHLAEAFVRAVYNIKDYKRFFII